MRHRSLIRYRCAMLLLVLGLPWAAWAQIFADRPDDRSMAAEYNRKVAMRDGVSLSTDIYRPSAPGRYPTILSRYPYGNGNGAGSLAQPRHWVENGYVFVFQDVRGRYDSDGEFYPYRTEAQDGYDTIAWIVSQPWSDGTVGMSGGSYLAAVQWLVASERPPGLKALAPRVAPFNYYHDVTYIGGALALLSRTSWGVYMSGRTNQEMPLDMQRMWWHLPLKTLDRSFGLDMPYWRDWIAHPADDAYWAPFQSGQRAAHMDLPALNIGGWYDGILGGTLSSYRSATTDMGPHARRNQWLIIGPWDHKLARDGKTQLGELEFGPDSAMDFSNIERRWFDHWLKGEANAVMDEAPVRLFVMGENRWRSEREWPLARTRYTAYYFHSQGVANTRDGDGGLSTRKPGVAQASSRYVYDPADPVPTVGGNLTPERYAGPRDQAQVEQRQDVLVFTSEPLREDLEVTGPVSVVLYAASSAPDTDFTAKLVDVHPDGKAYNLTDGIIRARYRESFQQERLLEPGTVYEYTIDLWATSNLFKRGHRIRVDVSSSNFPRFDRNPNTGHTFGEDAELRKAQQAVHHSRRYPSRIVLPVIPR